MALPKLEAFTLSSEADDSQSMGYFEEVSFSWQEKVFKTSERKLYSQIDNCNSDLLKSYNKKIAESKLNSLNLSKKIFSYLHADNYKDNSALTTSGKAYKDKTIRHLESLSSAFQSFSLDETPESDLLGLQDPTSMFILVDMNNSERDPPSPGRERVLFQLEWQPRLRRLSVSPDFNRLHKDPYTLEVNYDSKRVFQYSLERVDGDLVDDKKAAEREIIKKITQSKKVASDGKVFGSFSVPAGGTARWLHAVQVVSARGLRGPARVSWRLDAPGGWRCEGAARGSTALGAGPPGAEGDFHYAHAFEILLLSRPDAALGENAPGVGGTLRLRAGEARGALRLPARAGPWRARVPLSCPRPRPRPLFFAPAPSEPREAPAQSSGPQDGKRSGLGRKSEAAGSLLLTGTSLLQKTPTDTAPGVEATLEATLRAHGRARERLAACRPTEGPPRAGVLTAH